MNDNKQKAWCKTHPTGFIGKDQHGNWYEQCRYGYLEMQQGKDANCEIIIERNNEQENN